MKNFNEWLSLREAGSFTPPNIGQGYEALQQFWQQHQNAVVQFQDEQGQVHTGKLIDLMDEGTFVVQDDQGQQHDVHPQHIMGVEGVQTHRGPNGSVMGHSIPAAQVANHYKNRTFS